MAVQPNQDAIDEFSIIGPDATAAFAPASNPADATEFAGNENLLAAPRKSGLDEDEEEEDEDDDLEDDDDEDDDLDDDDLEDDDDDLDEDDDEEDEDEDEEDEEEDEVKPLKVKR